MFSATPNIEMLRYLISVAASGKSIKQRRNQIMANDVARAYFNAPNLKPTFVDICEEDWEEGDEDMCGELLVSMYGTRPAASNWQKCYTDLLVDNGFNRTRACACTFRHAERDIDLIVHGDDFLSVADQDDLKWLGEVLRKRFEISTNVIGHEDEDEKQMKILNRIITVEPNGYTYEPDSRHAELIIKELGLKDAKAVSSPVAEHHEVEELLDHERFKKYQSICARTNFLAIDRLDIQYASKECCRSMSRPTLRDWAKLKRLGRYLVGKPRIVYKYEFQEKQDSITVYSDANWASGKESRKSTSGGIILNGSHYVKSWSKTQSLVALSSAESELYALVKASAEALGIKTTLKDMNKEIGILVYSDASAALGIIQRQGLGRVRHIDCSFLFVQDLNARKTIQYGKVAGSENPADIGTKGLAFDAISRHVAFVEAEFRGGRPELCPKILSRLTPEGGQSEGECRDPVSTVAFWL